MKVYVVSDLHTDYKENMEWVIDLSEKDHRMDTLIVAGDVADSLKVRGIIALKNSFSESSHLSSVEEIGHR